MSNIRKTTIQITILHAAEDDPSGMPLDAIGYEIDEGDWLGQSTVISSEDVPPERVVAESIALGNDGGFFAGYASELLG